MKKCSGCQKKLWFGSHEKSGMCFDCWLYDGYKQIADRKRAKGDLKGEQEVYEHMEDSIMRANYPNYKPLETREMRELRKIRKLLEEKNAR
ncbi:MAG: hypothetical protein IMZ52_04730 [Actinobacteria bacterium]|nr:hypothetical protein [Actinomycetota bacterium]MBE3114770.1 hypothetical protein [Actinomycetota bacterium]